MIGNLLDISPFIDKELKRNYNASKLFNLFVLLLSTLATMHKNLIFAPTFTIFAR